MGSAGDFTINNSSNSSNAVIISTQGLGRAAEISIQNSSNLQTALYVSTNGTGLGLYVLGNTMLDGDLEVTGTSRCDVLEITGGGDIAEPFDIQDSENVNNGLVLSIDSENIGKLKLSEKAYDRCVAGIISGAGNIKPGMILSQSGSIADGKYPVALTGRVYCWADASNESIQPGDLLTTSNIPGYAMKVTDYDKAQGAIIGKAMSSLETGKGLVLVLVALQ